MTRTRPISRSRKPKKGSKKKARRIGKPKNGVRIHSSSDPRETTSFGVPVPVAFSTYA